MRSGQAAAGHQIAGAKASYIGCHSDNLAAAGIAKG